MSEGENSVGRGGETSRTREGKGRGDGVGVRRFGRQSGGRKVSRRDLQGGGGRRGEKARSRLTREIRNWGRG